ncbi:hypothetical protein MTO96_031347 [Rhipicephalus appendiculatus]
MLRNRLVCGVRDEALQRRLLAVTALDFKKAYEKAVAAEYATRQTAAIKGALPAASDLHRMDQAPEGHKPGGKQDSGKQSTTGRCSRCNGDHDATSCGFRYSVCHFCKRKGHIVRACHQKEAARSKGIEQAGNLEEGAPTVFPGECGRTDSGLFGSWAKWKFLSNITVERVNYVCLSRRAVESASWGETGSNHWAYLWKDCTSSTELQFLIVPGEKAHLLHATRAR